MTAKSERQITVGYFTTSTYRKNGLTPRISFRGYYLRQLGFEVGAKVRISSAGFGKILIETCG